MEWPSIAEQVLASKTAYLGPQLLLTDPCGPWLTEGPSDPSSLWHFQAAEGTQDFLSMLGSPSEDIQTPEKDTGKTRDTRAPDLWPRGDWPNRSPNPMTSGLCSALQRPQTNEN